MITYYQVQFEESKVWRARKDCLTEAEARAWVQQQAHYYTGTRYRILHLAGTVIATYAGGVETHEEEE